MINEKVDNPERACTYMVINFKLTLRCLWGIDMKNWIPCRLDFLQSYDNGIVNVWETLFYFFFNMIIIKIQCRKTWVFFLCVEIFDISKTEEMRVFFSRNLLSTSKFYSYVWKMFWFNQYNSIYYRSLW